MIKRKCESSSIPTSAKPRWGVETQPPRVEFWPEVGGSAWWGGGSSTPQPPANRTLDTSIVWTDDSKLLQKSNLTAGSHAQGAQSHSTSNLTLLPPSERGFTEFASPYGARTWYASANAPDVSHYSTDPSPNKHWSNLSHHFSGIRFVLFWAILVIFH